MENNESTKYDTFTVKFGGEVIVVKGLGPFFRMLERDILTALKEHVKASKMNCNHSWERVDRYWYRCSCGTLKPSEFI